MRYSTILFITVLSLFSIDLSAQQDPLYTQYMFNKLLINPGYAGSRAATSVTMLYRDQWTGFEGAPKTATASVHGRLANPKIALGLTLVNDRIGLRNQTGLYATYAYRLPVGDARLSFGIQAGFDHIQYGFSDAVYIDLNDPELGQNISMLTPNVGAGVYYQSEKFYAGVSVPHLLENTLGEAAQNEEIVGTQERHFFAMMGGVIEIAENVKFRPSTLVKYVANAPISADFNGTFLFVDKFWVGASYRTDASVDFHMEFNVNRQLRIGYAYDYVLGELGTHSNGSHEILLGIDLDFSKNRIVTPRHISPQYF
jgi:type IX secretion system PorP/SprF family membrane protein